MDTFFQQFTEIRQAWQTEITDLRKEQKALPSGCLVRLKKRDKVFYYREASNQRVGITKKPAVIQCFARKKYVKERIKRLEINLNALDHLIAVYRGLSHDEIIKSFSEVYHDLPFSSFFKVDNLDWEKEPYAKNTFHREQCRYATNRGLLVRSKSELVIANILEMKQIPFRYEAELQLAGGLFYPDFTIRKKTDGTLIYWEHFGLIDKPDYARRTTVKLAGYAAIGIIPWKNLVCTYEEDIMNSRRINHIIDVMLL